MGDVSNGYECDVFICAFAADLIAKFRSPFLDVTFGERVRYYVMADDNWEIGLFAAVKTGKTKDDGELEEEHFRLERMPLFYPVSDDIALTIADSLGFSEEQIQSRLAEGAQWLELEEKKSRAQVEAQIEKELEEEEEETE